jgi:hypothetical protein
MFLPAIFLNEVVFFFHLLRQTLPSRVVRRLDEHAWTRYTKWIRVTANITAVVFAAVEMWAVAGFILLGSTVLWLFLFLWIAEEWHTLVDETDADDLDTAFLAAHAGVINFVLDVPGIGSDHARGAHYIIQLSNLVAIIALAIGLSVSTPLEEAWGCYPPDTPLSGLTSGRCASAYQVRGCPVWGIG